MNRIHKGLDAKDFEYSGDAVQRSFCTVTGLLAGDSCSSVKSGWFKIDNLPGVCSGKHRSSVDETSSSGVITVFG